MSRSAIDIRVHGASLVTASGKNALRKFPLNQLKDYIAAYDIVCPIVLEKDDVVDAIISARVRLHLKPPRNASDLIVVTLFVPCTLLRACCVGSERVFTQRK